MSFFRINTEKSLELGTNTVSRSWVGCDERSGTSAMCSLDELVTYFAGDECGVSLGRGHMYGYLVEFDGELSDAADLDAHEGAVLVHPTRVLSVEPIEARFEELVKARIVADLESTCSQEGIELVSVQLDELDGASWTATTRHECDECDDGVLEYDDGTTEPCDECDGSGHYEQTRPVHEVY